MIDHIYMIFRWSGWLLEVTQKVNSKERQQTENSQNIPKIFKDMGSYPELKELSFACSQLVGRLKIKIKETQKF